MKVEKGKKIKMEYELSVDGGDLLESSETRGPLEYFHGEGRMLAGLERQIEGLEVNDEKEGLIPAAEAYGTEDSLPTSAVSRSEFPEGADVKEGASFEARGPDGNPIQFTVVEIDDETVTVRFNHPLAGKDIRYRVKILNIEDVEELDVEDLAEEVEDSEDAEDKDLGDDAEDAEDKDLGDDAEDKDLGDDAEDAEDKS